MNRRAQLMTLSCLSLVVSNFMPQFSVADVLVQPAFTASQSAGTVDSGLGRRDLHRISSCL
ncbi:MAG: hypothetical protein IPK83_15645 [Planctomycetes bacterium]|nr:hypothetical protein [Planctomycetota bacterium]